MTVFYSLKNDDKELVIKVHGRFDFALQKEFHDSYDDLEPQPQHCTVDLEHTTHLDSSALGTLLVLREKLGKKVPIKIINSRPEIERVLKAAGFEKLFELNYRE